jgi:surface polysaccharide O-acyltransferase-like enzyme
MDQALPANENGVLIKANLPLQNRLASADILKLMAIFGVVYIHGTALISFSKPDINSAELDYEIVTHLFSFCVPVFIILWAYFMNKSISKKGTGYIISRFYKLLIPFLFWSTIYFLILADFKIGLRSILTKYWLGYGWSGQYYFIILFQLLLFFPVISRISKYLANFLPVLFFIFLLFYILITYSGLFNIHIIDLLGDRPFFYWIPYAMIGIIYSQKEVKFKVPVIVAVCSLALIPLEYYFLNRFPIRYLLPSTFVASFFLFSSFIQTNITYQMLNVRLGKIIEKVSASTLGIFCINPLVVVCFKPIFTSFGIHPQFPGCTIIIPIISAVFVMCVCLLVVFLFKLIKLGKLVAS